MHKQFKIFITLIIIFSTSTQLSFAAFGKRVRSWENKSLTANTSTAAQNPPIKQTQEEPITKIGILEENIENIDIRVERLEEQIEEIHIQPQFNQYENEIEDLKSRIEDLESRINEQ